MTVALFDLYFPLPYRICYTILLGIYLWAINVHFLTNSRIDVQALVKYTHHGPNPFHSAIYHFASTLAIYVSASWILFVTAVSHKNLSESGLSLSIRVLDLVPILTLFGFLFAFVLPGNVFHASGRKRFRTIVKRILLGGLDIDCRFADILISDALTSYNKVLLDLVYTLFIFLSGQTSLTNPNRNYGGDLVAPLTMGYPSLVRLSQCIIDYLRTGATIHVFNCLKYASAFPILITALFLKKYKDVSNDQDIFTEYNMFRLWTLTCLINSSFSFYWDVTNDWGLELFSNFPAYKYHGLRRFKMLGSRKWYYSAVIIDFVLRAVWLMKFTYSWKSFPDLETGLFVLEIFEISRRGMWIYFRTEKEWITSDISLKEDDYELPLFGQ